MSTDSPRNRQRSTPVEGPARSAVATLSERIGDTRLSAVAAGLATVVAAFSVGGQLVGLRATGLAVLAGAAVAGGLYTLASERLWRGFLAGVVLTPASLLLTVVIGAGIGFGLETGRAVGQFAAGSVLLLAVAGFAAVLTTAPLDEGDVLADAFPRYVGLLVPMTVVQAITVTVSAPETIAVGLARLFLDTPEPALAVARTVLAPRGPLALLTFLASVLLVIVLLQRLVSALPIATAFPPRQRPAIAGRVHQVQHRLGRVARWVALGGFGLAIAALAVGLAAPTALRAQLGGPLGDGLAWLLTAVPVRAVLVLVIGVMGALLAAERLRRRVRRLSEADLLEIAFPPLGAAIAAVALGIALDLSLSPAAARRLVPAASRPIADAFLRNGVFPVALLAAFGSLILVGVLFVTLTILVSSPLLPERALGPALAASVVFVLVLVLVLFGGSPLLAFVGAALAIAAWDNGEYATGLRDELPSGADTTRGELVHVGGSLAVGVLAVTAATGLELLIASRVVVPEARETAIATGAVAITFAVIVLSLSTLRE